MVEHGGSGVPYPRYRKVADNTIASLGTGGSRNLDITDAAGYREGDTWYTFDRIQFFYSHTPNTIGMTSAQGIKCGQMEMPEVGESFDIVDGRANPGVRIRYRMTSETVITMVAVTGNPTYFGFVAENY